MPDDGVAAEIAALGPWFHNLHLPGGAQTEPAHPLGDFPSYKWDRIKALLPADMTGWRVLDIGCNAGFYCFELARLGADVTGIDINPHYLRQARWAAEKMGLSQAIAFRQCQVYDLAASDARYDLVLFLGVFYHLRYPLLALDVLAEMTPRLMVFQTLSTPGEAVCDAASGDVDFQSRERLDEPGWPKMAFVEHTICRDPTNWWVPNHAGVLAMLRSAGFAVTAHPGEEIYLCRPDGGLPLCPWDRRELLSATGRLRAG